MLIQQLLYGLAIGAIYALIALGFTMLWNTAQVVNFAQGEFAVISMFLLLTLHLFWGLPLAPSLVLAVLGTALCGMLLERVALRRVIGGDPLTVVIVTLGLQIVITSGAKAIWGTHPFAFPAYLRGEPLRVLGAVLNLENIWIVVLVVLAATAFWLFTQFTMWGKAVRAVSQDRDAAWLMGINVNSAVGITFAVSTGLAGMAGVLLAPIIHISSDIGLGLLVKSFIAAVVGGYGNYIGAMLGGFLIGVVDNLTAFYISSNYRDVISFSLLILVLVIRPSGLFGRRSTT